MTKRKMPHDYQERAITNVAIKLQRFLRVLFQLATGGGKTVVFSTICHRYISKSPVNKVLIMVHREELMQQARTTLYEWYGIIPELLSAGNNTMPTAQICITMVETANNRLKKNPSFFSSYNLAIVDECHLGNHLKVLDIVKDHAHIIGFTATPISSRKKFPLNAFYQDIVCGIDIHELIDRDFLLPNCTYRPKQHVDLSDFTRSNGGISSTGEFNENQMADRYKKGKHVINTITQYKRHAYGKKTVVFNCNVEHSMIVMQAFRNEGVPCRHLDGSTSKEERKDILRWFKHTHNAVLCNVGVATTGFDEPSIYCVIVNRDTLSLSLWLQMCGRGGRRFAGLDHFIIIDMGTNQRRFGDWSDARDWNDIFHNPDKPREGNGVAPTTECPECEALIHVSARVCKWCGCEIPREMVISNEIIEFELAKQARPIVINVEKIIDDNPGLSEFKDLHLIKNKIIGHAKNEWLNDDEINDDKAYSIYNSYMEAVKEWFRIKSKPFTKKHRDHNTTIFFDSLKTQFGYVRKEESETLQGEMLPQAES